MSDPQMHAYACARAPILSLSLSLVEQQCQLLEKICYLIGM
jgi:hypothetical protein